MRIRWFVLISSALITLIALANCESPETRTERRFIEGYLEHDYCNAAMEKIGRLPNPDLKDFVDDYVEQTVACIEQRPTQENGGDYAQLARLLKSASHPLELMYARKAYDAHLSRGGCNTYAYAWTVADEHDIGRALATRVYKIYWSDLSDCWERLNSDAVETNYRALNPPSKELAQKRYDFLVQQEEFKQAFEIARIYFDDETTAGALVRHCTAGITDRTAQAVWNFVQSASRCEFTNEQKVAFERAAFLEIRNRDGDICSVLEFAESRYHKNAVTDHEVDTLHSACFEEKLLGDASEALKFAEERKLGDRSVSRARNEIIDAHLRNDTYLLGRQQPDGTFVIVDPTGTLLH
ncbi:MAG: hypothetical protein ABIG71_04705 [Candidatus Uhrbacteria bacterium]